VANIQAIQDSLYKLHRATTDSVASKRRKRRNNRNTETAAVLPNFSLGDYVLVGTLTCTQGHKLAVKWRGPHLITTVDSDWVYQVEDLLNGFTTAVHASRLKLYCDQDLNVTEELLAQIAHQQSGFEVASLRDLRWSPADVRYETQVAWRGFEPDEDTWEPLTTMLEDVPALFTILLARHPNKDLMSQVRTAFDLPE
jgi:hypothetical protein